MAGLCPTFPGLRKACVTEALLTSPAAGQDDSYALPGSLSFLTVLEN